MTFRRAVVFVVALVACGGGGGSRSSRSWSMSGRAPEAGPADIPAMRALLERYSPTGHFIVSRYEALPREFVLDGGTWKVSFSGGFGDFFDDGAPYNLPDYMATAVHEVYHGYASLSGYQLLADAGRPYGLGAEGMYVGGETILVSFTETFPAREMAASFPADARTSRFGTYVSESGPTQSTQTQGVFGFLDELAAYHHSARTMIDLWPWVRDEAPMSEQLLINYVARFHAMWEPYAEFRLFILHYLRTARDRRPDVYRGLMANESFRRAYAACDAAYAALLAEAAELEPTIHVLARSRGVNADLRGGQLTFDGSPFPIRDAAYPAVLRHLASPPYQEILAELEE